MKLLVTELSTERKQKIVIGSENVQLYAVRLHLYRHLNPTGTLTVELRNAENQLLASSAALNITSIPATLDYFHGWIRFLLSYPLKKNTEYFIALKAGGGYSFSESAYIGWCNDFDLRHVSSAYAPDGGTSAPLGIEVWSNEYKTRRAL